MSRDQKYTYDGLHRLKNYDRGNLTGTAPNYTGIASTPNREQAWTLDQQGNWSNFVQKTAGTTNINQTRVHNSANEIDVDNDHSNAAGASITGSPGNWVDPLYDAAGNTTEMPSVNVSLKIQAGYDAWNRMVVVFVPAISTTNPVAKNEYDGLNRRIVRQTDPGADGTIDETRHYYYTEQWQVIEERIGADPNTARPDVQYVWGPQYVDDLVVRYRDADANGSSGSPSLEEELYSMADANFNVTAVTDNTGAVQERFSYMPYGFSTVLDNSFAPKSGNNSTIAWNYRYTTREYDPSMVAHLQLNRNRWYHQQLGRWTSRDPIGYRGSQWNLYEYVQSSPTLGLDPTGEVCVTCSCLTYDEYAPGKRWKVDVECGGRASFCCQQACLSGGGYSVDFNRCGTTTDKCTFWEVYVDCSKSKCAIACAAKAAACASICRRFTPKGPLQFACLDACAGAAIGCAAGCMRCKDP